MCVCHFDDVLLDPPPRALRGLEIVRPSPSVAERTGSVRTATWWVPFFRLLGLSCEKSELLMVAAQARKAGRERAARLPPNGEDTFADSRGLLLE